MENRRGHESVSSEKLESEKENEENIAVKIDEPKNNTEAAKEKTLKELAREMEEYYSNPKRKGQALSDMDELYFFKECIDAGKVNISSFNEDYISDAPLFYESNSYENFFKDLAIYLALEKHRNCLLRNEEKVKTPVGKYYFKANLASNKASSFFYRFSVIGIFKRPSGLVWISGGRNTWQRGVRKVK